MSNVAAAQAIVAEAWPQPMLFRALSLQPGDGAHFLVDAGGRIGGACGDCVAILGRAASTLLGVALDELLVGSPLHMTRESVRESTRESLRDRLAMIAESGFERQDTRMHRANGTMSEVNIAISRAHDFRELFVCSVHDIGARRGRESAMGEDSEGYRAVFEHALDPMFALDDNRCILDLNAAARDLLSTQQLDPRGAVFESLLAPTSQADFIARWNPVLGIGEDRGYSRLRAHDGLSRHLEYTIRAHYKLGHHLVVVRDVTARDELEYQLRRAQKLEALGRLAGGVAHDFNNLLTAVLVSADSLLQDAPVDDSRTQDLQVIREAAHRASSLTRQLLSFGKQQSLAVTTFDVHAVLLESLRVLQRLIGPPITIECAPEPGPYFVRADEGQIEQVLLNLALNARDAMPSGGTLRITTRVIDARTERLPVGVVLEPVRHIELVVSDNGVGMDASVQARLFEPFFTTKASEGTGLGLPTVYGIVTQCGGAIHVHSEKGRGSAFTVFLPEGSHPTPPRGVDITPATDERRRGRLLLVDDDPAIVAAVARILSRAGHWVTTANGASEALALASVAETPFDVLVSDISMPGMGGVELAGELIARDQRLHTIFITGDAVRDVSRIKAAGRRAIVLRKPFSMAELELQVQLALRHQ